MRIKDIESATSETVFFGDWHGHLSYALDALERSYDKYPNVEVLYHVGDFGVWPGNEFYVDAISQSIQAAGKTMLVTGGNHENWTLWDYWTQDNTRAYNYNKSGLVFLPKVYRWNHGGETFVSCGGASSIDRNLRIEGISWWREEEISHSVVQTLKNKKINKADVLITHESTNTPVPPIQARLDNALIQAAWDQSALKASEAQRDLVTSIVGTLSPNVHVHGHWHLPYLRKDEELLTASLGDNTTSFAENSFYHAW